MSAFATHCLARDLALKLAPASAMDLPRLVGASLALSNGLIATDKAVLLPYALALTLWTGQRPRLVRAKRSLASFALKAGAPLGCAVTLRGAPLADFLARLHLVLLPQLTPRPVTRAAFQGGRVDFGLASLTAAPEVAASPALFAFLAGCGCSLATTAPSPAVARVLLSGLHFPVFKTTPAHG